MEVKQYNQQVFSKQHQIRKIHNSAFEVSNKNV